jgi:tRNA(Ile)-lysidine synthase
LWAAHYNHRLRGPESDGDQQWAAELCDKLQIGYLTEAASGAGSLASEEQARDARYEFLQRAAEQVGARYVATAHTADDQVETLLLRIFRGTGVGGLAGIPSFRPLGNVATLVRPMLATRRAEVEGFLQALGQDFRHDASNADNAFTRNWVRNELLPLVRQQLPYSIDASLLRLSEQAREWHMALGELVESFVGEAIAANQVPPLLRLHTPSLTTLPSIVVQEGCRRRWRELGWPEQSMTQADWQRLASAVAMSGPVPMLPGGFSVAREGEWLVVIPAADC